MTIALLLSLTRTVEAEAPTIVTVEKPKTQQEIINDLIEKYSTEYNVSSNVMHTVINCESTYNPKALGDNGNSRGLVQIHQKYHPDVTDEMAYNPDFAIKFLAEKLQQNKGHLWTCYRKNFS